MKLEVDENEGRGAMGDELVLEAIRQARNGVADAENDLARLLGELQVAPRAEKTTISEALQGAFQKIHDAREHLGKLEDRNERTRTD